MSAKTSKKICYFKHELNFVIGVFLVFGLHFDTSPVMNLTGTWWRNHSLSQIVTCTNFVIQESCEASLLLSKNCVVNHNMLQIQMYSYSKRIIISIITALYSTYIIFNFKSCINCHRLPLSGKHFQQYTNPAYFAPFPTTVTQLLTLN